MTRAEADVARTSQEAPQLSLVARALGVVRRGWLGLAGQVLSFAAMLMPIAFRAFDQLSALLVASAGAQVLSYTFSLGFPSVFPRIRESARLRASILASSAVVGSVCALLLVAGAGLLVGHKVSFAQIAFAWAGMTACQAVYLMTAGMAVRFARYDVISSGRLVYGASVAALTLVACLWSGTRFGLVLAASTSYLIAGAYVCWGNRHQVVEIMRSGSQASDDQGSGVVRYIRETAEASGSAALTGLASQLNLLIIPGIGVYHDAWTGLMRLAGGVTTVSMQLIAPALDIEVGEGVREGKAHVVSSAVRREFLAGAGLSLVTILVSMPVLAVAGTFAALDRHQLVTIVVCASLYIVGQLSVSAMFNTLLLLGEDRLRLLWAAAKSAMLVGVIVLGGSHRLQWCTAVEVLSDALYLAMVRRGIRRTSLPAAGRHRRQKKERGRRRTKK